MIAEINKCRYSKRHWSGPTCINALFGCYCPWCISICHVKITVGEVNCTIGVHQFARCYRTVGCIMVSKNVGITIGVRLSCWTSYIVNRHGADWNTSYSLCFKDQCSSAIHNLLNWHFEIDYLGRSIMVCSRCLAGGASIAEKMRTISRLLVSLGSKSIAAVNGNIGWGKSSTGTAP